MAAKKKTPDETPLTWDQGDTRSKAIALAQVEGALQEVRPILRTHGTDLFLNAGPDHVSVRDGFDRNDYNTYRPEEATPRRPRDLILFCDRVYQTNGIVSNVIDMMGDFTAKGISLVHPNDRVQTFYQEWFKKVNGPMVTERFANYLFRMGTVVANRQIAKLKPKDEDELRRATGTPDTVISPPIPVIKREIPWRYTFYHPASLELLSEEIAPLIGPDGFLFAVRIPPAIHKKIKNPKGKNEVALVAMLPDNIVSAVRAGEASIPLDPNKTCVFYYKRDDWLAWGKPLLKPILDDLNMLKKMKLADLAALDGAISCIRVWKLGSLEHRIMPHPNTILRLASMLTSNVGGGVMDLVWGPDLELLETSTEVHRFLGSSKYGPVMQAIYSGLGIPQTLTGAEGQTGFTNNYISLKVLTDRLAYGREIVTAFWNAEIKLVQRAMGFRFPAKVTYDSLLRDETTEKQLLLNLADRDLIDVETLQDLFGLDPDIIAVRQRRDERKRKSGKMSRKASPFHNANVDSDMEKLFAGTGAYAPSEFGVETKPVTKGQKSPSDVNAANKAKTQAAGVKGQPGQGRPKMKKDKTKRKQKTVKPRTKAFIQQLATARAMQEQVADLVTPVYLKSISRKNLRELTDTQTAEFEDFKFSLLCQFAVGQTVTESGVKEFLQKPLLVSEPARTLLKKTIALHTEKNGSEPTLSELRLFQASVFTIEKGDHGEETNTASDGM